jgi:hypothetical protein
LLVKVERAFAAYGLTASTGAGRVAIPDEISGAGTTINTLAGTSILVVESSHLISAAIAAVLILEYCEDQGCGTSCITIYNNYFESISTPTE